MERINRNLISPCGMNCGICIGYLRKTNKCNGCKSVEKNCPKTRAECKIRNCKERKGKFCFTCIKFPCQRLLHLDKRYRTKYGMSEIENLKYILSKGIDRFTKNERKKWESTDGIFCVHDKKHYK